MYSNFRLNATQTATLYHRIRVQMYEIAMKQQHRNKVHRKN